MKIIIEPETPVELMNNQPITIPGLQAFVVLGRSAAPGSGVMPICAMQGDPMLLIMGMVERMVQILTSLNAHAVEKMIDDKLDALAADAKLEAKDAERVNGTGLKIAQP